jgi:hypothetical protein
MSHIRAATGTGTTTTTALTSTATAAEAAADTANVKINGHLNGFVRVARVRVPGRVVVPERSHIPL